MANVISNWHNFYWKLNGVFVVLTDAVDFINTEITNEKDRKLKDGNKR